MVDIFVNKSGNDGDSGLTRALAKLTLGGAFAIAVSGDVIKVGAGVYENEALVSPAVSGTFLIEADFDDAYAPVIFDGTGITTNFYTRGSGTRLTPVFRDIIIRNYTNAAFVGAGGISLQLSIFDVTIHGCAYGIRSDGTSGLFNSPFGNTSKRVLMYDITTAGFRTSKSGGAADYFFDTFTFNNCAIGVDLAISNTSSDTKFDNCLFSGNVIHVRDIQVLNSQSNFCSYNFSDGKCVFSSVDKVTLAEWQAATLDDAESKDQVPVFVDEANRMLRLDPSSPALSGFENAGIIHAGFSGRATFGVSNNRNSSLWTAAVINDVTLVSGKYELTTPPDGDVAHDVINFGKTRTVRRVVVQGVQNYPLEVLDQDETDVEPNRPQMEYRISDTSFLKGAGAPAFVSFVNGEDLNVSGKFFQTRVTLRNDGVSA